MKPENFKFLLYLILLTLLTAPAAMADTTVIGQNNPAVDVPAVKGAVDEGGVVTLQGTFDFGDDGVTIENSVEIVGGDATIKNGVIPFMVWAPESDVVIRDITLYNATERGIAVYICKNFLAERVEIADMKVGGLYDQKDGIWTSSYIFDGFHFMPNTDIEKYHVIDCDIDLGSYSNNFEGGRGISVWGVGWPGDEVEIIIKGNTVRNCSRHCVMVNDFAGNALIEDNIIISGNTGYYAEFGPNGIITNQSMGTWFDPPYESNHAQVSIVNNYIESGPELGEFPYYLGIWGNKRDGLIVINNQIKIHGGSANIWIGDLFFRPTSNDGIIVKQNKFSGSGMLTTLNLVSATNGVIMNNNFKKSAPEEEYVYCFWAENNTFVGNNTTDDVITYYFDVPTANNTVRGHTGGSASVVDLGTDNYLTGVTPMAGAGGTGRHISGAMQELHERLSNGGVGPPNLP